MDVWTGGMRHGGRSVFIDPSAPAKSMTTDVILRRITLRVTPPETDAPVQDSFLISRQRTGVDEPALSDAVRLCTSH